MMIIAQYLLLWEPESTTRIHRIPVRIWRRPLFGHVNMVKKWPAAWRPMTHSNWGCMESDTYTARSLLIMRTSLSFSLSISLSFISICLSICCSLICIVSSWEVRWTTSTGALIAVSCDVKSATVWYCCVVSYNRLSWFSQPRMSPLSSPNYRCLYLQSLHVSFALVFVSGKEKKSTLLLRLSWSYKCWTSTVYLSQPAQFIRRAGFFKNDVPSLCKINVHWAWFSVQICLPSFNIQYQLQF